MNTPIAMVLSQKGSTVYSVASLATVADAVQLMQSHHVGSVVVLQVGHVVGLITEREVLSRVVLSGRMAEYTPVTDIMIHNPVSASPRTTVGEALELLADHSCNYILVLDDDTGSLLGILSSGDLMRLVTDAHRAESSHLRHYLSGCCF